MKDAFPDDQQVDSGRQQGLRYSVPHPLIGFHTRAGPQSGGRSSSLNGYR